MAKGFILEMNPAVYIGKYQEDGSWVDNYYKKPHLTKEEEAGLPEEKQEEYIMKRNSFPELPLVNYTTQYGFGCFEGLKAFPQADGSLKIFINNHFEHLGLIKTPYIMMKFNRIMNE
jgi:branched-chain amino acid aminotransferase